MGKSAKYLLASLGIVLSTSCSNKILRDKLNELDSVLDQKELFIRNFHSRMDSVKRTIPQLESDSLKWETAYTLFTSYAYVNVDSAFRYLDVLEKFASTAELKTRTEACRLRGYSIRGMQDELEEGIGSISGNDVSENFRQRFYDEIQRAYVLFPNGTRLNYKILTKALEFDGLSDDVRLRYQGILKLYDKNFSEALEDFKQAYRICSSTHIKALAAYNIATCYNKLKEEDKYCYWLAQSAIYDFQVPVSEYLSLLELAQILVERKEYKRASNYIQVVLEDALKGNWNSRIQLSASNQISIVKALQKNEESKQRMLQYFIAALLLLIASIILLLARTFVQNKKLHRLNKDITKMNDKLRDEGRIKENYLFKYMEMSVAGIGRVDEYRLELRQVMKDNGMDAVKHLLRAPQVTKNAYKDFYNNFDSTFLSLYPNFTDEVNKLMQEDCKFEKGAPLCTDLRILATIRLGFTDSGQIARFLNMPPTSIYTRRSALRRNCVCDKAVFEDKIRKIV